MAIWKCDAFEYGSLANLQGAMCVKFDAARASQDEELPWHVPKVKGFPGVLSNQELETFKSGFLL
jgi:hypothetical protein